MKKRRHCTAFFLTPILAIFVIATFHDDVRAQDCSGLEDLRIPDTNLLSAAVVKASEDLPEYCRVLGYVRPAINFEIRLPTSNWNGKFYMAGCGGTCGKLESDNSGFVNAINYGLKRNYAVSTMDGGHWGENLGDGRWAYHNRLAEIDFGYRAVHETAVVTKQIIKSFYGHEQKQSYFAGCSTGGRQALMEAQRYPDDFDGLISGAPDLDATDWVILSAWLAQANVGSDGQNIVTPATAELLRKAVHRACDKSDGLEDGLIADPRACRFDLKTLACDGGNKSSCLAPNQVDAVASVYDGPSDSSGQQLYPGLPHGSESSWVSWVTGETADAADDPPIDWATQYLRYMVFSEDPGDQYSVADFDFDSDPQRMQHMAEIYNADNPDLTAFRESGGKLLIWHGWADAAVPPDATIAYYESVEGHMGSKDETQRFLRLFMIPGMPHCGFGEGPGITSSGFDPLTSLEQWVEEGAAPTSMITTKTDSTGAVLWRRPICPYPQHAVYDGDGDVSDASNFKCVSP